MVFGYDSKLHVMVSLHFLNFKECTVPVHYHYSQAHSNKSLKSVQYLFITITPKPTQINLLEKYFY